MYCTLLSAMSEHDKQSAGCNGAASVSEDSQGDKKNVQIEDISINFITPLQNMYCTLLLTYMHIYFLASMTEHDQQRADDNGADGVSDDSHSDKKLFKLK